MDEITLPNKILFTGAPGSKWSAIAQTIEAQPGFNITDRTEDREYTHHMYSGHKGAYFGHGMEFEAIYNAERAYADPSAGTMVVKSHELALDLKGNRIYECNEAGNWMMLVYRPSDVCMEWWLQAGGFEIKYPDYSWYEDNARMAYMIRKINDNMLRFAYDNKLTWSHFTAQWVIDTFGRLDADVDIPEFKDVLVTIYKP